MEEPETTSNPLAPIAKPWQALLPGELAKAGQAASAAAARHRFEDYRLRHAAHTLRRQEADLALFEQFLASAGAAVEGLAFQPTAWNGITWGLVEAFVKWQLGQGYAVPSVNVHLSTIKTYARLAMQAGTLAPQEYALIRAVQGYSQREQRRIDQRRPVRRIGLKKAVPVPIPAETARALKNQPATPQGRRDALLLCLLLDHGLRAGEAAALTVENLDLSTGLLRFFRPKVGKAQAHRLSTDTLAAARACQAVGELTPAGLLLRRSLKNGKLGRSGLTTRAITAIVRRLGEEIGLPGLSAHDCRHHWATTAARGGTDPFVLQEAGGWSSLTMPRRYVAEQTIANEGVKLDE